MSEDTDRVVAEVDSDAKEIAKEKLDYGELSEVIRDTVNTVAYGGGWDRHTLMDRQIEKKRDELRDLRRRRREIDNEIQEAEEGLEDLLRDREEIETKQEKFEGALWTFEQSFRRGEFGHLLEDDQRLENFAEQFDKQASEIFETLKERNPDIPEYAFTPLMHADGRFEGVPDEDVQASVDERRSL